MKRPQRNVSEDLLSITQRNKRKTSDDGSETSLPIPIDLVIEIFSMLSLKSIARCRCVSKLWASILRRPDFTELFLTISRARPHILLACQKGCELFFFSVPQPQNPDENLSSIVASHRIKFSFDGHFRVSGHVHGLVGVICFQILTGRNVKVPVICNPSTGQSLGLLNTDARSLFGYDPVSKKIKILCKPAGSNGIIMTLETGNMSRRMIECFPIPYDLRHQICINGVLYYLSWSRGIYVIGCVDVRSEKFSCIEVKESFHRAVVNGTMINYNGKLGLLRNEGSIRLDGNSTSFKLWVLEDLGKQEWSEHLYLLPALWKNIVGMSDLNIVGATQTNEIVFESRSSWGHFYLFYFNIQRNTVGRVEIQGIDTTKYQTVHTFLDHVENVKLM